MQGIRPAAVAGAFYPAQADALRRQVQGYLDAAADPSRGSDHSWPKALIVPHAGYVYSGAIAASAYARLRPGRDKIKRVVLFGPVHRVPVRGMVLPEAAGMATPLGVVPVDAEAVRRISALPYVGVNDLAHAWEHALEVQLPFLQVMLDDFKIVPLAVGNAKPGEVAEVLNLLWGGEETLILVSSDLSHYLPYDLARQLDGDTAKCILHLEIHALNHEEACGATPINGLMMAAHSHALRPQLLDLRNSGDTAGPRDQVVGYGAFAFYEEERHVH